MILKEDYPLKELTTFHIGGAAKFFVEMNDHADLSAALRFLREQQAALFVLGGGSNVLISEEGFDGLVVKIQTRGVTVVEEHSESVLLKVAAGECWDDLVRRAVCEGWWGIENLSYIPGNVGALAIQNVGAYGQEASQVIEALEVCEIATGDRRVLSNSVCQFAYRSSVFNTVFKGKYLILHVFLRLVKHGRPELRYRDLRDFFSHSDASPGLSEIRDAVVRLRTVKLPDPKRLGNAGSFFKNLVVSRQECHLLVQKLETYLREEDRARIASWQSREAASGGIKISTAWLLDRLGLKGLQKGGAALYASHPLILVNASGSASAYDVLGLMQNVRQGVFQRTGLEIRPEPNFIGFAPAVLEEYFQL